MFIRIDVFWGISMAITEIDGSLSAANCYHNQLKWRKTGMRHKMIINACRRNVVWMFIITPVKPLISLASQWLEGRYIWNFFMLTKISTTLSWTVKLYRNSSDIKRLSILNL